MSHYSPWQVLPDDAAPNFEWDTREPWRGQSGCLVRDEALKDFKRTGEAWESALIEILELIPAGDHVVVRT